MISRLKDGSVILNGDECMLPSQYAAATGLMTAFTDAEFVQHHGMIFFNQRIYHSQAGEHIEGVRSHPVELIIKNNIFEAYLGKITVLECVDDNLRQRFIDTMKRWDPVERLEELRNAPRVDVDNEEPIKLPTPFLDYFRRRPDPAEQTAKCEMFRAIRAYQRNHVEPPAPLSSKGVACGNFIFYSFKAAMIEALFPNGLPDEIIQKMAQIDALRSENKALRKGAQPVEAMKLADVSKKYPYLDELMQLVAKYITPAQHRYFEFLQAPVKGTSVNDFCRFAINYPEFWQPTGVMFGYKDKDENIPYVMNYAAYKALRQPDLAVRRVTDFLLPEAKVEEVVAALNPARVASPPAQKNSDKTGGNSPFFQQSSESATSPVTRTKSPGSKQ